MYTYVHVHVYVHVHIHVHVHVLFFFLFLFRLWNILESDVSFLNQMCVSLLLACQEDIVPYEVSSADSPSSLKLWKCISDGFSTQRWKITIKTGLFVCFTKIMLACLSHLAPTCCKCEHASLILHLNASMPLSSCT